jgi:hypothetical protein
MVVWFILKIGPESPKTEAISRVPGTVIPISQGETPVSRRIFFHKAEKKFLYIFNLI